jgi:hypothetical protein
MHDDMAKMILIALEKPEKAIKEKITIGKKKLK